MAVSIDDAEFCGDHLILSHDEISSHEEISI